MAKISGAKERDGEIGLARKGRTGHGAGDAGDGREAMIGGWMWVNGKRRETRETGERLRREEHPYSNTHKLLINHFNTCLWYISR